MIRTHRKVQNCHANKPLKALTPWRKKMAWQKLGLWRCTACGAIQTPKTALDRPANWWPTTLFQLAQLVYADFLMGRTRPLQALGDAPHDMAQAV